LNNALRNRNRSGVRPPIQGPDLSCEEIDPGIFIVPDSTINARIRVITPRKNIDPLMVINPCQKPENKNK